MVVLKLALLNRSQVIYQSTSSMARRANSTSSTAIFTQHSLHLRWWKRHNAIILVGHAGAPSDS